ncbi:MAG: NIPSNAP family containing protein [Bacteroidales bacterium]|jgi:hypothetical protein|nr:NIPSNAP family containing protein [Bacteroidales bacterium]
MKKSLISVLICFLLSLTSFLYGKGPADAKQMYYELKIYRLKDPAKNTVIDKYLRDAFIPAMHRAGINNIGVFKPVQTDTASGKLVYVFIPYKTSEQYFNVITALEKDKVYLEAGKEFLDASYDDPPFTRYESVFMKAFSFMPEMKAPVYTTPRNERIYELRSYESATIEKARKKIHMFNEGGEMAIFEKIGSNAVFYGQVLFGSLKPRLMYMTTYANMKSHDEHWAAFRAHPDWKVLSAKDEYKNTVTKANPYLLYPTDYSDF